MFPHRPCLTLNANLTSSERCVGLQRLVCAHRGSRIESVLLLPHKNTYYWSLTRRRSGFWNRMIHLPFSSTLQLCNFKQNHFPRLSFSDTIYFSVWPAREALHGLCSAPLPSRLSHVLLQYCSSTHTSTPKPRLSYLNVDPDYFTSMQHSQRVQSEWTWWHKDSHVFNRTELDGLDSKSSDGLLSFPV